MTRNLIDFKTRVTHKTPGNAQCKVDNGLSVWINKEGSKYVAYMNGNGFVIVCKNLQDLIDFVSSKEQSKYFINKEERDYWFKALNKEGYETQNY